MARAYIQLLLAIAAAGGVVGASTVKTPVARNAAVSDALQAFLARPAVPHEYRASRRLEAAGVGQRGWLDVQTGFSHASGFFYEVTSEGGSGYIRSRVLHSLLDEERRLIAQNATPQVALSPANYTFEPDTVDADGLAVVSITPRRKERALIDGRMFLTPGDGALVRVEGRLARTPFRSSKRPSSRRRSRRRCATWRRWSMPAGSSASRCWACRRARRSRSPMPCAIPGA